MNTKELKPAAYSLSKDYEKLYELVNAGFDASAFVDYEIKHRAETYRDICRVRKYTNSKEWMYVFGVRGMTYCDLYEWQARSPNTELSMFLRCCESMNLEWIDNAIPKGFALVPIEFIEQAASDNNHRSVNWRRSTINIFSKLMRQIENNGKNTARGKEL